MADTPEANLKTTGISAQEVASRCQCNLLSGWSQPTATTALETKKLPTKDSALAALKFVIA